jgi:hypothetical protein
VLPPSVAVGAAVLEGAGVAAEVGVGATFVLLLDVDPEPPLSLPPQAATTGAKESTSAAARMAGRRS